MDGNPQRVTLDNSALRARSVDFRYGIPRSTPLRRQGTAPISDIAAPQRPAVNPFTRNELDFRKAPRPTEMPAQTYIVPSIIEPIQESPSQLVDPAEPQNTELNAITDIVSSIQAMTSTEALVNVRKKTPYFKRVAYVCLSIVIIMGIGVFVVQNNSSQKNSPLAQAQKNENNSDTTQETPVLDEEIITPTMINSYTTDASQPRIIRIKKASLDSARVLSLSTDQSGVLNMPNNIWDTGWYEGSAFPGSSSGATLIIGHVNGPTRGGAFYNLYRLMIGDQIDIETGDGHLYTYQVVEKGEVPDGPINLTDYIVSKQADKQGLTLMTSSGEFNPVTQEYEKPLVVFAIRTN